MSRGSVAPLQLPVLRALLRALLRPSSRRPEKPQRPTGAGDAAIRKTRHTRRFANDRSKWWCATPSAAGDVQPARSAGEHPHRPRPRDRLLPLPAPGADDGPTRAPVLLVEADRAEASAPAARAQGRRALLSADPLRAGQAAGSLDPRGRGREGRRRVSRRRAEDARSSPAGRVGGSPPSSSIASS